MGGTGVRPMAFDPVPLQAGWLDAAALRPHGSLLALGAGRRVRLWDGDARALRQEPAAADAVADVADVAGAVTGV